MNNATERIDHQWPVLQLMAAARQAGPCVFRLSPSHQSMKPQDLGCASAVTDELTLSRGGDHQAW